MLTAPFPDRKDDTDVGSALSTGRASLRTGEGGRARYHATCLGFNGLGGWHDAESALVAYGDSNPGLMAEK